MAITSTRLYGKDLPATGGVVITPIAGAAQDITAFVQSVDFERTWSTADTGVLGDPEESNRAIKAGGKITITCALDSSAAAAFNAIAANAGSSVNATILTVTGGTGDAFALAATGAKTVLLNSVKTAVQDSGQVLTIELMPDGSGGFV